jgi:hypothetical protein
MRELSNKARQSSVLIGGFVVLAECISRTCRGEVREKIKDKPNEAGRNQSAIDGGSRESH